MNELYNSTDLQRTQFIVSKDEETTLLAYLKNRTDMEARRMERYLAMPDLSRIESSPLYDIKERVTNLPILKNFDDTTIPEIVPTEILFDLFEFAPDHPARSKSDTYYVDEKNVLRPHITIMWYYYLNQQKIKEKIAKGESIGTVCYGKVFRKDEIDRQHMNIFHQMEAWYLQPDSKGIMPLDDLRAVLKEIVESLFPHAEYRFLEDTFPYTDPSLQIEVKIGDRWIEIMGGGMPKKSVLKKMGLEGYNGWAFGFGLERLAIISMELPDIRLLWSADERVKKQLKLGQKFVEVSKYPAIVRDISFVVSKDVALNNYFDLVRDIAGDMAEEVTLMDTYTNDDKLGAGNVSYAFRITYRSLDRTLTSAEVDALHKKLEEATVSQFAAKIR